VRRWFDEKNVERLVWPARSPDLNPIENIWAAMARDLQKMEARPRNKQELWTAVEDTWEDISANLCAKVVGSMRKRLEMVIENNGGWINY
jgi:hypothetical protein